MAWKSIADLLTDREAPVALLGVPMEAGSVTPGRCDLAPETVRQALRRFSDYDLETGEVIDVAVRDLGDLDVRGVSPADAFDPVRKAIVDAVAAHALTIVLGGNNAVTRPAAHGLALPLDRVGLITFDAHFDMRETDQGPMNGNPVRCLLEDGLPGGNLVQIALQPFANTRKMHADSMAAGAGYYSISECVEDGMFDIVPAVLGRFAHVDAIIVDFDIDVIDRAQLPGAPGARPGGLPAQMFFDAARLVAADPRVRVVDLTEFDPSLDVSDISALTAARWVAEILAGFQRR